MARTCAIGEGIIVNPVFIEGEPVLSGGRGQGEWQEAIRKRLGGAVRQPSLTFVVSALRRRGQPFDLDNLVHPVLMVLDEPVDCVSARLYVGDPPGLLIEDRPPASPPPDRLRNIYLVSHSTRSDRDRDGIVEIAGDSAYLDHEGLGLSLAFDSPDIPIRRGWFGPTEAVIDDLAPWLGRYTSHELVADHRIRDLRIVRGVEPRSDGVRITLWYVRETELTVPSSVAERIGASVSQQGH